MHYTISHSPPAGYLASQSRRCRFGPRVIHAALTCYVLSRGGMGRGGERKRESERGGGCLFFTFSTSSHNCMALAMAPR
eukprot:5303465-Pyramimonas_sp.AAC.1